MNNLRHKPRFIWYLCTKEMLMRRALVFIVLLTGLANIPVFAQEDPTDRIASAIRGGDARSLAGFFNETIDLGLPDNDNSYSSSQGEMIMRDFFKKYPPASFEVIQKGTTDPESRYAIGTYKTATDEFRVYINLRKDKADFRIHKLKFEEK